MASLLDLLGRSARAAYPFLRSLASAGVAANDALDQLKAAGLGIRRDVGLTIYRTLQDKADVSDFLKLIGENAALPQEAHSLSPVSFSNGNLFQYTVGTNSDNSLIPEAIYVNSKVPLSANEIYSIAAASFKYEEGSGMSPDVIGDVTFTIDDARYSPEEL